jgi:hypothetical protein
LNCGSQPHINTTIELIIEHLLADMIGAIALLLLLALQN